jgi:alpha-1,2-mannosyltransferase
MTSTLPVRLGPFAVAVHLSASAVAGIVGLTASAGIVDSMPIAAAVAVTAAAVVGWRLATHPGHALTLAGVPHVFRMAFCAGALVVLAQLAPLTAFIIDPYAATWQASAVRPWQSAHSCVSCYWVAAVQAPNVPDLYAETVYRPVVSPNVPRRPNLGPFFVDVFEYPPTFLPLPRVLAWTTPDFWGFRRLWFAVNLAGVVLGLLAIARRLDTALGTHAIWLTPWALAAPSMIGTLQAGNVQLLFIVQSAVAMLLFERRRHAVGGVLLGYAIASKLYPAVLVLYLLLRGDWRAIGWTAAAGLAITGIALADVGWTPFAAFLDHLPKILSGEAFPGLFRPPAIAINSSIPGVVFKLGLFGVPGMGIAAAQVVGWIFTVVMAITIAWFALRRGDRRLEPLVWIAILLLATLRSPFLPGYGTFPTFWLASLVMAVGCARPRIGVAAACLWLVAAVHAGQGAVSPQVNAVLTFGHTLAALVIVFAIVPRMTAVSGAVSIPEAAVPTTA